MRGQRGSYTQSTEQGTGPREDLPVATELLVSMRGSPTRSTEIKSGLQPGRHPLETLSSFWPPVSGQLENPTLALLGGRSSED